MRRRAVGRSSAVKNRRPSPHRSVRRDSAGIWFSASWAGGAASERLGSRRLDGWSRRRWRLAVRIEGILGALASCGTWSSATGWMDGLISGWIADGSSGFEVVAGLSVGLPKEARVMRWCSPWLWVGRMDQTYFPWIARGYPVMAMQAHRQSAHRKLWRMRWSVAYEGANHSAVATTFSIVSMFDPRRMIGEPLVSVALILHHRRFRRFPHPPSQFLRPRR